MSRHPTHLPDERDGIDGFEVVDGHRAMGQVECVVLERQRSPIPDDQFELRGRRERRIQRRGRREDLRAAVETDDAERVTVRSCPGDECERDVRRTRADVEHRADRSFAVAQAADRALRDVDAAEPAVDPSQIAEVAGQDARLVQRAIEQFLGTGQAIHPGQATAAPVP